MQVISLLNKALALSFPVFLFSFDNLYQFNNKNFDISIIKNGYKLTSKNQKYLDYNETKGFQFFIPYFTKEFALKVLRYNSTGYINGILSMDKSFSKILKITPVDYKYYLTDYNSDERELDYLLKGYSIPYYKVTSISIEAYNIPPKVSKKLNKYIYFEKLPLKQNKLSNILYSFYIILDKNKVDDYIKSNYPKSKNYINTFLKNIYNIKLKSTKNITPKKPKLITKKKIIKPKYRLHLNRFLYMKEYGYIPIKYNTNIAKLTNKAEKIVDQLDITVTNLTLNLDENYKSSKEDFNKFNKEIEDIKDEILKLGVITPTIKCKFDENQIDKKCFSNRDYFQDYLYFRLKNNQIVSDDEILSYGGYKSFNDIGKYYFEIGEFRKSELYLQRAYVLAKNKDIISHNLGVFYANPYTPLYNLNKAITYLEKSNMDIDNYNIGVFYYLGKGVKESDKIARKYFKKALSIPFAKENYEIMKKYKIGLK